MFPHTAAIPSVLANFRLEDRMFCYNTFVPKFFNWCLSLGFTPGKIVPSRAFCSDESQGFPIILITKHFGAFPFNHGRVGGIVSTDRHGPHADHAQDLALVQASHVGYEPETGEFGIYRRLHTEDGHHSCSCGKIGRIIGDYAREYDYAAENVRLLRIEGRPAVLLDNMLMVHSRHNRLTLHTNRLIAGADHHLPPPIATRSTGQVFLASESLVLRLGEPAWPFEGTEAIGKRLAAEDFHFTFDAPPEVELADQLESNLVPAMPWILTAKHPLLTAACVNTVAEFERTYRTLVQAPAMQGRNLLFLAGLNIDISPQLGDEFPQTKFVPWAAFVQRADGHREILEQDAVFDRLAAAPTTNPHQIDLEHALGQMSAKRDAVVHF